MNQTELNFLQEALVDKVNKLLISIVDNAATHAKKEQTSEEKPKTTKKGETK